MSQNISNFFIFFIVEIKMKHFPASNIDAKKLTILKLVNIWHFLRIFCKYMWIWNPKHANIYKEMYVRREEGASTCLLYTFICKNWQAWDPMYPYVCNRILWKIAHLLFMLHKKIELWSLFFVWMKISEKHELVHMVHL